MILSEHILLSGTNSGFVACYHRALHVLLGDDIASSVVNARLACKSRWGCSPSKAHADFNIHSDGFLAKAQ